MRRPRRKSRPAACRVLITGAGTGASENLIRGLRRARLALELIGASSDAFSLRRASTDRRVLLPPVTDGGFRRKLRQLVVTQHIDLVVPTSDEDVLALTREAAWLGRRAFLPDRDVVHLCQDKQALSDFLRAREIPAPQSYPVASLEALPRLFRRLGGGKLWCRVRTGTRSLGAAPVTHPAQARAWILHWEELRGVPRAAFTLAEYLPGRDFLCQSLWNKGDLVLIQTFERLAYFGGEGNPSGVSSLSSTAKTVADRRVVDICTAAIRAIAPRARGAFSVDLKEDRRGVPCITEINAGRCFIGMTAFDRVMTHSLPGTYVRLALGKPVGLREVYDAVPDWYLVRDLDMLPTVFHADQLHDGIEAVDGKGRYYAIG